MPSLSMASFGFDSMLAEQDLDVFGQRFMLPA
jgi:hypothetical protein